MLIDWFVKYVTGDVVCGVLGGNTHTHTHFIAVCKDSYVIITTVLTESEFDRDSQNPL